MKIYMRLYANSNVEVQQTIRKIDKKSNYIFPLIDPPIIDSSEEQDSEKNEKPIQDVSAQAT